MALRVRIIPLTMAVSGLFLMVKLVDVIRGTEALSEHLLISSVEAQQAAQAPQPPTPPVPPAPATPAAGATPATPPANGATPAKADAAPKKVEEKKDKNANISGEAGETVDRHFSAVEVELLQNLAKRREELDRWEENIQIKESALDATEKRIDDKVQQINAMKKEVSDLLAKYNQQEDEKIKSLVKIYENMKPVDAARIFDEVEMPILLLVIDQMAEKKAAPILADMNPKKAKQITVELAEERRVNTTKVNTVAAATQPVAPAALGNPAPAASAPAAQPAPAAGAAQ